MNTFQPLRGMRPKHQALVLKCYPRFTKNNNLLEIKPNSSELSYLLYYANTRKSKLQKVGTFLERKTAIDIAKERTANVQVTLQILTSLIQKCPRDLSLYSLSVLRVLDQVLSSEDISLLEESIPTFETFCAHHDRTTLAPEHEYMQLYDVVIGRYVSFATKTKKTPTRDQASVPLSVRYRTAGLQAIKCLVSADSFVLENGRQLQLLVPPILDNLHADSATYLTRIQMRENTKDELEKEQTSVRRRQSVQLPRRDTSSEVDPTEAIGSTADQDEVADEQVGVIALQSLRQIFSSDNPGQGRLATSCTIEFILSRTTVTSTPTPPSDATRSQKDWALGLFELACRSTPVQNRFILVVTATDMLIRRPIVENDVNNQLILVRIIDSLLRSSLTFIGLSVNDILIGFIQHILLLLQLGGEGSSIRPHRQRFTSHGGLLDVPEPTVRDPSPGSGTPSGVEVEVVKTVSSPRLLLLQELQDAIGNLAYHVYYADQISEMVSALLMRLKPPPHMILSVASAIEDPAGAADAIADSGQILEKTQTDDYFSFDTARLLALGAVKKIITTANSRRKDGLGAGGRNRVDASIWDGTQWLLCDVDKRVRKAYVEAILTWLRLELDRSNLRVPDIAPTKKAKSSHADEMHGDGAAIAKRALSNASRSTNKKLRSKSTFLQLLHLAIYDCALQHAESESDMLLLHLFHCELIRRLGVNSVRYGLPMIFRLQEDILTLSNPHAKDSIGSLVHGYLWALSEFFEFENSPVGHLISQEISRRSKADLWLNSIRVPPKTLEDIANLDDSATGLSAQHDLGHTESLRPFEQREALVDCIADAYSGTLLSPPSSPPMSPGRHLRKSSTKSIGTSAKISFPASAKKLPAALREDMLSPWSKEACVASVNGPEPKTNSLNGSRHGSGSGRRDNGVYGGDNSSPRRSEPDLGRSSSPAARSNDQHSPARPTGPRTVSSKRSMVRVSDLKHILATGGDLQLTRTNDTDDSDSMMSVDEASIN